MIAARRIFVAAMGTVAVLAACTGLKSADGTSLPADGGRALSDAESSDDDDDVLAEGGVRDASPAPVDFECEEAWTTKSKTHGECEARTDVLIDPAPTLGTTGISIARTPAGRIGVSYNTEESTELGVLHLIHFVPNIAGAKAEIIEQRGTRYEHVGYRSKLAATAPDTLHLLTYDRSSVDGIGIVHSSTLVDGQKPLTAPQLVVEAIKGDSEIAFAVAPDGTSYATARIPRSATASRLVARTKAPGALWSSLENLPSMGYGLLPEEAPGSGAASLHVDANGLLHLLFHHNEVMAYSTPRYHALAATSWTYRKTIDNNVPEGLAGYSPRIATFGSRKIAVFYFRRAQQEPAESATADLRLVTWTNPDETPSVEIIDQGIPAPEPMHPRYAAAMAVDTFGLVHLALVRPGLVKDTAVLEYRRQQQLPGGKLAWLKDVVAPEVLGPATDAFVDLVVDERARPHITYRTGVDTRIHYATRYDR